MAGKAEKLFKDLGRKIDNFLEEMNGATDNLQDEFKQRFEELKKNKEIGHGQKIGFQMNNDADIEG